MTIEALQEELTRLSDDERRRVREFLDEMEDGQRLGESVADYRSGRTVPVETVHKELRAKIGEA